MRGKSPLIYKKMSSALVSGFFDFSDVIYKPSFTIEPKKGPARRTVSSSSANLLPTAKMMAASTVLPKLSQAPQSPVINGMVIPHRKLDRSMSEPVQQQQSICCQRQNSTATAPGSPPANSSRYKTELCRPYEESGTCKYGDKCQFAHGGHELRTLARHPKYKTELCRTFHTTGFCPYGPRCHFIHNGDENKKNMMMASRSQSMGPDSRKPSESIRGQRPKALSIGSFSLGSAGDLSPPSSLSASPTSLNGFFGEDPFKTPTTAFSFSQDFANALANKGPYAGGSQLEFLSDSVARDPLFKFPEAPPSPVDSISDELDGVTLAADLVDGAPRLPIFSSLSKSPKFSE